MTDRELLELAARAAGMRITWGEKYRVGDDEVDCTDLPYVLSDSPDESPAYWNPLEDDGDALRLAIDLEICIEFGYCLDDAPIVRCGLRWDRENWPQDGNFPDSHAATRRAVVRAAAALATKETPA